MVSGRTTACAELDPAWLQGRSALQAASGRGDRPEARSFLAARRSRAAHTSSPFALFVAGAFLVRYAAEARRPLLDDGRRRHSPGLWKKPMAASCPRPRAQPSLSARADPECRLLRDVRHVRHSGATAHRTGWARIRAIRIATGLGQPDSPTAQSTTGRQHRLVPPTRSRAASPRSNRASV